MSILRVPTESIQDRLQALGDKTQNYLRIGRLYDHEASVLQAAYRHPYGMVWTAYEHKQLETPKHSELAQLLFETRLLESQYGIKIVCEVTPNYRW